MSLVSHVSFRPRRREDRLTPDSERLTRGAQPVAAALRSWLGSVPADPKTLSMAAWWSAAAGLHGHELMADVAARLPAAASSSNTSIDHRSICRLAAAFSTSNSANSSAWACLLSSATSSLDSLVQVGKRS